MMQTFDVIFFIDHCTLPVYLGTIAETRQCVTVISLTCFGLHLAITWVLVDAGVQVGPMLLLEISKKSTSGNGRHYVDYGLELLILLVYAF